MPSFEIAKITIFPSKGWFYRVIREGSRGKKLDVNCVGKCIRLQTLRGVSIVSRHFSFASPLKLRLFPLVILNALYFSVTLLSYS